MSDKPVAAGRSSFDHIDLEAFFSLLDPGPDETVADLACGIGLYSLEIAKRISGSGKVHAVDLWEDGIAILDREIRRRRIANIVTHVADITQGVPLDSNSLHTCLLAAILHDLPDEGQAGVLREAARILRPGGTLAVVEFSRTAGGPGPPAHIRISEQELEQRAAPFGFSPCQCSMVGSNMYLCRFGKET